MNTHKELIVYVTQSVAEPHDIQSQTLALAAECAALGVEVIHLDDLSTLSVQPAIGLDAEGTEEQFTLLAKRLTQKGYTIEDGGREIRALDQEGGAK